MCVTIALRGRLFVILVMSGWMKLPEEVVEVGSACGFQERPDSAWLSVFGDGSM